jgi:hypothetical protein
MLYDLLRMKKIMQICERNNVTSCTTKKPIICGSYYCKIIILIAT